MVSVNGLKDVVAACTEISEVDGAGGTLTYRGFDIGDLVATHSFEDVAFLLWTGHLPSPLEQTNMMKTFRMGRQIPETVYAVLDALPSSIDVMNAAAIGLLSLPEPGMDGVDDAIAYTAAFPLLALRHYANTVATKRLEPADDLGHVANMLYLLSGGTRPSDAQVQALEAYMVLTMEHSLNASAFAARVTASTRASMSRAVTSALMTMTGPLHGGAPSEVMAMFDEIRVPSQAEAWLSHRLASGERIMGFGHRIYRTVDPRAKALRAIALRTCAGETHLELARVVETEADKLLARHKPGRHLHTNVEYWAASVLDSLKIPRALFTTIFSASRLVGWTAHILEQKTCDTLIRPNAKYVGARGR